MRYHSNYIFSHEESEQPKEEDKKDRCAAVKMAPLGTMPQDAEESDGTPKTPSPSTFGGTKYSFSRQKLNEIVKALRDCGTEEIIKLPKIAVIGNQSAGKSSLIESISQIKVPRATGTCTRCPMEVILTSGGLTSGPETSWHCKVSLRIDHPVGGHQQGVFDFDQTTLNEEVPHILRRAQLAILNPNTDVSHFIKLDEEQCTAHVRQQNFSRNTVVMEISGAEVDVTFIDLPGIISFTEKVCSCTEINVNNLGRRVLLYRLDQRTCRLICVPTGVSHSCHYFNERYDTFCPLPNKVR